MMKNNDSLKKSARVMNFTSLSLNENGVLFHQLLKELRLHISFELFQEIITEAQNKSDPL
jgi:hypothetical protein